MARHDITGHVFSAMAADNVRSVSDWKNAIQRKIETTILHGSQLMHSTVATAEPLVKIVKLLEAFDGEEFFKQLFWEILSYDRVRDPLPKSLLPPSTNDIVSHLEVFADSESLTVAYAETQQRPAGWQLELMAHALQRHLFSCILVLNHSTGWAVVYPDDTATPRVRFLALPGPAAQKVDTARALLALNACDDSDEALSRLEQSEQLDSFFPGVTPNLGDIFEEFDRIAKHKDPEVRDLLPFVRAISVYPLLTIKQERGEDLWGSGTPSESQLKFYQARLVNHNLRMVVWMASKCPRMGMTLSDLVQEGALGLMVAARRFEIERGNRFSTYAFHWIRQSMYRAVHNQCNLIRWPVHIASSLMQAVRTKRTEGLRAGEKPVLYVPDRLERASFYETDPDASVIAAKMTIACAAL